MVMRVTVVNNAKQSQKAPLLIPASAIADPTVANSIRSHVFKSAQSKLKLKKPSRVYVGKTGQELTSKEGWRNNIKNDVVLFVSAGEEYVGARKEPTVHADVKPDCPTEFLASNAPVDSLAITQLTATAHTLPGIVHAVGQPDLHPGTKFPIGAVFASKKWIHPPLIGGDIGCGMSWFKLTLPRSQVDGDKGKKVAEKLRGLEGPWRTQEHRKRWDRMKKVAALLREGSPEAIQYIKEHDKASKGGTLPLSTLVEDATYLTIEDARSQQEYVYIRRKGAAPTYNPETRLPLNLLPLPGSRGTPTLILQPSFSALTSWGLKNALSLAHGAGRSMSRAKALSLLSQKYKGQNILQPRAGDIEGTWVVCDEKDLVFEEAPDACKDVQAVGQDLVDAGVANIIGWCRARVSYKVRNEEY
ncbi:hypothetical protein EKO04_005968 [Ascochyta lentis]|uniref:3'-phosphate/5'-hydroxy nucleic acid ligase n=1 Tax=Ascochyta lentis TaxID=205686 RepID=A0A8H7MIB1_9PLEO|nr:hypothetical protein EKO04_005968 [Ascochyta lentis]